MHDNLKDDFIKTIQSAQINDNLSHISSFYIAGCVEFWGDKRFDELQKLSLRQAVLTRKLDTAKLISSFCLM